MSERPEWMPRETFVLAATLGSLNVARLDRAFRQSGLRAQIAAWEEMLSMFNGPSLQIIVREKIAALQKELA